MISASRSYDVVILGSGIAGLAGALAAHALGLRPVVIEKAATLGGGTVHSYWSGSAKIISRRLPDIPTPATKSSPIWPYVMPHLMRSVSRFLRWRGPAVATR
jgi:flavin-dependent dehydrogenase